MSAIESVLVENRVFPPSEATVKAARISGMDAYNALCDEAERDFEGFWARLARENVVWTKPFTKTLDESKAPFYKWFEDGELNASANCLDKHMGTPVENKTAIIFEADDGAVTKVTYRELLSKVGQMANALKAQGIRKGDRVIIYMPMTIEGVVAMQACARIGATHSVVFGGFSAKALNERIIDAGAVAVITANYQMRGGKEMPLKAIVDEGIAMGGCNIAQDRDGLHAHGHGLQHGGRARQDLHRGAAGPDAPSAGPSRSGAEHPLFILYTSGSTGKPKGVQHSTGGYLLWAKLTMDWTFDIKPSDVFWCTADIGWVTGHTYVAYGPLAAGATEVIFEGIPTYPNAGPLLADDREAQGERLLHRADRDPLADQGRRGRRQDPSGPLRPEEPAHPRHGGRADQSRSLDVVLQARGRRALPHRRHLLADRDRRPHDHAAAGRDAAGAGLLHVAPAGHHGRHRRRGRPRHCRTAPAACWWSSARGRR